MEQTAQYTTVLYIRTVWTCSQYNEQEDLYRLHPGHEEVLSGIGGQVRGMEARTLGVEGQ
jgi:hypothetical protein